MKNVYLFVGASGSGKTTIIESLEKIYHMIPVQSYTTRRPRYENETSHIFVTPQEFANIPNLAGYTKYQNNEYGATEEQVESGDLYTINPDGIKFFRKHYKGKKGYKIIYIDANLSTRYERMVKRTEEENNFISNVNSALERIKTDINEFYDYFHGNAPVDFTVNNNENDKLEDVVDKVYQYICSCESEVM